MQNYNEIIDKLKDILSEEVGNKKIYDKDVATALEIKHDTFRKQKSNNKIPYLEIMSFLAKRNISINWFFFNQLPESLIEATSNFIILKYQKSVIASAGGGAINYEIDTDPLIIDKQLLDHINSSYKYTEVLQVFGESMEPDIKEGSLIFVDKTQRDIKQDSIYMIRVNDSLYIKSIKQDKSNITLISTNTAFDDIHYNIDEIDIIGRVCGVLIKI
ncbi:MAG: LexA family transcriptional repressor [Arcobacter sp.]|nr:MAG: LexA family transcriptional repressor [Arcobacter sp.]